MKKVLIIENWTRDLGIPQTWIENAKSGTWEIWNAARPFPAHYYHKGEFMRGVFYGVIDPAQDMADEFRGKAQDLDASQLTFISQDKVNAWGCAKCTEIGIAFEAFDYETMAESYLNNHT